MVILVDSREQKKLKFKIDHIVTEVKVLKLDVGDYAAEYIDGSRCPVVFERKSLGDLFGTMTKGYPRFKKEMGRAAESETRLVLAIEAGCDDIIKGYRHSRFPGESMVQKLQTLWMRYNLPHLFLGDSKTMAKYIRGFFVNYGMETKRGGGRKKGNAKASSSSTRYSHTKTRRKSDKSGTKVHKMVQATSANTAG